MARDAVVRVVEFLAEALRASGLRVGKLVLFGSQARGTAHEDSDIDLAIVSEDFRGKDIFDRSRAIKEAEVATVRRFLVPLDIVMLTPDEYESRDPSIPFLARDGEEVPGD